MKTAIIGAARNRNGIGQFIARYFHRNKAEVAAVVGSTDKSSEAACLNLQRYGIDARSYSNFYLMVKEEKPDTVVIASPSHTHYEYVLKCIECGVKNIFCEKPFLWTGSLFDESLLSDLFSEADKKQTVIGMNSQWIFALPFYENLCGEIDRAGAKTFFMRMSPSVSGLQMLPESMPHVLSILFSVFGSGNIGEIVFEAENRLINIAFLYRTVDFKCRAKVELRTEQNQPRTLLFGFNNRIVSRELDINSYDIWFNCDNKRIRIADPLEMSVKNFIDSAETGRKPFAGKEHIVNTTRNLLEIYKTVIGYEQIET